jgi:CubicO group peptidase (beta-lactamase class C family)
LITRSLMQGSICMTTTRTGGLGRRDILTAAAAIPLLALDGMPAAAVTASRGTGTNPGLADFERRVRATMAAEAIPGMTAGFARGSTQWVRGYGYADLENKVPATAISAYRYASVQKPMTAVAVLQLVERGKIDLDADIREYVPYFPPKGHRITPRQLLGHIAGIPDYASEADEHLKEHKTTREAIALFADRPLIAAPGTRFKYTSYGYNLLGAAIETASGKAYGDHMREHVWRPAGMTSTRMEDPAVLIPNRVRGYRYVDGQVRNSEFVDVSSRFAAGASRGTVPDLLRFGTALCEGRLISPASMALMRTPMRTSDGKIAGFPRTDGYGMGWSVLGQGKDCVLFHDGGQPETRTMLIVDPQARLTVASAQNYERDIHPPLAFALYAAATGKAFPIKPA